MTCILQVFWSHLTCIIHYRTDEYLLMYAIELGYENCASEVVHSTGQIVKLIKLC